MKWLLVFGWVLSLCACGSDGELPLGSPMASPEPSSSTNPVDPSPSPSPSPSGSEEITCSILGIIVYQGPISGPITGTIDGCYTFTDAYGPVTICADCTITN